MSSKSKTPAEKERSVAWLSPQGVTQRSGLEAEAGEGFENVGLKLKEVPHGRCAGSVYGNEWPLKQLQTVAREVTVGYVGSMASEYVLTGVPFLRSLNIEPFGVNTNDLKFITPEFHQRIKKSSLRPGDVAIVRTGKPGTCAVIPDWLVDANCSDLVVVRCGEEIRPHFLCYWVNSMASHHIESHTVGAVQQHFNVGAAKTMGVAVPSLQQQDKVLEVLRALDDRITLLRETNATLEAIAQALFKSWFVDFDPVHAKMQAAAQARAHAEAHPETAPVPVPAPIRPPESLAPEKANTTASIPTLAGMDPQTLSLFPDSLQDSELGLIPSGWKILKVADVAQVVKGKSYSSKDLVESHKTALVTLKSFERGGGFRMDGFKPYIGSYKPEQVVESGDLIVAYTDVTQAAELIGKPAVVVGVEEYETLVASLDVGIIRPNIEVCGKQFLYGLFRTEPFQAHTLAHTSGTTVLHLAKDGVGSFTFTCPPKKLISEFESVASAIAERKQSNSDSIRTLTQLRDTLLPRLISGQLRLPEAQEKIEEALA